METSKLAVSSKEVWASVSTSKTTTAQNRYQILHNRLTARIKSLSQWIEKKLDYYSNRNLFDSSVAFRDKNRLISLRSRLNEIYVKYDSCEEFRVGSHRLVYTCYLSQHSVPVEDLRRSIQRDYKAIDDEYRAIIVKYPKLNGQDWEMSKIVEKSNEVSISKHRKEIHTLFLLELLKRRGWYQMFVTLTIDPKYYDGFVADGCKNLNVAFKEFIRKIQRHCVKSVYGSYSRRGGKNLDCAEEYDKLFRYFAITEPGAENGRLHMHVFMLYKNDVDFPFEVKDANKDLPVGERINREAKIREFRQWWSEKGDGIEVRKGGTLYGFVNDVIFRIDEDDAWGKKGFVWPDNKETRQPLQVGNKVSVANYLTKYFRKWTGDSDAYRDSNGKIYIFKTKKSRKFGSDILNEILDWIEEYGGWEMYNRMFRFGCPVFEIRDYVLPIKKIRVMAEKRINKKLSLALSIDSIRNCPSKMNVIQNSRKMLDGKRKSKNLNEDVIRDSVLYERENLKCMSFVNKKLDGKYGVDCEKLYEIDGVLDSAG